MIRFITILAATACAVSGAPPAPLRLYQHAPAHSQANPLDYFAENDELHNFYIQQQQHQQQHKQGAAHSSAGAPARLENLEPDSEVELIPGAQAPQQPPQQNPVSPNVPGLVPGQRVFIVHMPVAGYRPGTIGGYQPVYIVAAAPQGNNAYAANGNGYQNAILLSPTGQVSSYFGYQGAGTQGQTGVLVGGLPFNRPFDQAYQNPAFAYQPGQAQGPQVYQTPQSLQAFHGGQGLQGFQGPQGLGPQGPQGLGPQGLQGLGPQGLQGFQGPASLQFSQLVSLQGQRPVARPAENEAASNAEVKRAEVTAKENQESRRNPRPAHAARKV